MEHLYKSKLQTYAQKRGLGLPEYACTHDGPPHDCRFSCKVTLGDVTFQCDQVFNTVKDSENAVAKLALTSLIPPQDHQQQQDDDLPVYKNLLQELSQKQGFSLPTYTSQRNGMSHIPTFVATVDVKGEIFQGAFAKTKKLAEMNAAKVAYNIIKQRDFTAPPASRPIDAIAQQQEEEEVVVVTAAADMLELDQASTKNNNSPASQSSRKRGPSQTPVDAVKVEEQASGSSANEGRCKKVCIFPRNLNMELPPGKTVFSDDRWIAIETCQAEAT